MGAGGEVEAHLGAAHHQAVAHVVAGVAKVNEVDALEVAEVLLDGEEVRENLGGVELVGEAVEHRHPRIAGEVLYDLLAVAAVLDAVEHPAQARGRCRRWTPFADLAARGIKVGHFHAQIVCGHLKAAAGAGGGLFKDQGNVFARKLVIVADAGLLFCLQVGGKVQQFLHLGRGVVQ